MVCVDGDSTRGQHVVECSHGDFILILIRILRSPALVSGTGCVAFLLSCFLRMPSNVRTRLWDGDLRWGTTLHEQGDCAWRVLKYS